LINRASIKYDQGLSVDESEMKIENERLKTTIMILTQKLKMKEDDSKEDIEQLTVKANQLK